jgi:PAS domain S-box-containing protein
MKVSRGVRSVLSQLLAFVGALALSCIAALVSRALSDPRVPDFAIRPQVALVACALLFLPLRFAPSIVVASFLGLLASGSSGGLVPGPLMALASVAEAALFALGLWVACRRIELDNARHLVLLIVIASLATSLVGGIVAGALAARSRVAFVAYARIWSISDALVLLLALPLVSGLASAFARPRRIAGTRFLEILVLSAIAAAVGCLWFIAFPLDPAAVFFALTFPLPFLLWIGARFGTLGTALASAFLFGCAAIGTVLGKGVVSSIPIDRVNQLELATAYSMWFSLFPLFNASAIERRKRSEAALAAGERKLQLIFDSIDDIVVAFDPSGAISSVSPAYERLTLFAAKGLLGGRAEELLVGSPASLERALARVGSGQGAVANLVLELKRADGSVLVCEAAARPLTGDEGGGVLVTMHDLTERAAIEGELMSTNAELEEAKSAADEALAVAEQALEAKGIFLSNMSHEIRTPLTGVLGMASLLAKTDLSEAQSLYVDRLKASSRQLLGIVNDILDVEKLEYGIAKARSESVDVEALCRGILGGFEAIAAGKGIALVSSFGGVAARLSIDPALLGRVVSNLVGNALKFTAAGRVGLAVSVVADEGGERLLRLVVFDSGIGMDEATVSRIFERFYQLDSSFSKRFEGTGLGLNIVKRAVDLMGGSIRVESEPGKGSTFTVDLPCSFADTEAEA